MYLVSIRQKEKQQQEQKISSQIVKFAVKFKTLNTYRMAHDIMAQRAQREELLESAINRLEVTGNWDTTNFVSLINQLVAFRPFDGAPLTMGLCLKICLETVADENHVYMKIMHYIGGQKYKQ